jgi:hypothetical protein
MALIELPPAPDGMTYVNKVTANGAQTVLVNKSSLSEDICTATGRTWVEEAKLYNIQNAPDGKKIAEPGDPFYQTPETMKNRGNLFGGAGASNFKFLNQLKGIAPDKPPSLSETMDKIKSGSINANLSAGLDKVGEVTGSLPTEAAAGLASAKAAIAAKMSELQKDLPKLMAKANASVDALTKKSIAATGKPPSEAEIKATQGALAIFQDGPKMIEAEAAKISQATAAAGKDFGVKLNAGVDSVKGLAKAGLDKVTDLAKKAGDAITDFANKKPAETIPDPTDPTKTIPNPAFTAFAAKAGNATKLLSTDKLTASLTSAGDALTSKFSALEEKGTAALTAGDADVKALGIAGKLAAPAVGLMAAIKTGAFDPGAFDAASISKAFAGASKLGPSIDTALYAKTKDEDLTYTGDDGLVWDRVNTERLRRSLSGLPTPRPKEPPLVPAGTTPPKDPATVTKISKSADLDSAPAAAATAKKSVAFGKEADELITNPFVNEYYKIKKVYDAEWDKLDPLVKDGLISRWMNGAYDFPTLAAKNKQIVTDKPDATTRTPEEKLIVNQRNFFRGLAIAYSEEYLRYLWVTGRCNEINQQYKILRENFMAGKTFGELPLSVEEAVMKDSGPPQWKKFVSNYYASYDDFAKANPDKAAPPTA